MRHLLPLYNLSYAARYLAIATTNPSTTAIILNPNSGPGDKKDPDFKQWASLITTLRKLPGLQLFGYIDLVTWHGPKSSPRPSSEIATEARQWTTLYGITTYFYDDYQTKTTRSLPNAPNSIANPGCESATVCGTTMVWETDLYTTKSKTSKQHRTAIYALREKDYRPALQQAIQRKVAYFHATHLRDGRDTYDDIQPPYLTELNQAIAEIK